jgi:hypothetical protein
MEEYKKIRSLEKINLLLVDSIRKLRSLRDQLDLKADKKAVKMQILLFQVPNNLLKAQRLLEGIAKTPLKSSNGRNEK